MAEVKDYSAEALLAKENEVELDTDDVASCRTGDVFVCYQCSQYSLA